MFTRPLLVSSVALAASTALAVAQLADFPPSLRTVAVPEPPELAEFILDRDAAIQLGKALFWDRAVGSDRATACASCHGSAGVDPRRRNVVHPGANGTFDGGVQPGDWKGSNFFPTTVFEDPASRFSARLRNVDDVAGSQGVLRRWYIENQADAFELCEDDPAPPFGSATQSHRQVTGRNSPTVINAVFNIRNFWDGRANPWFNGVNGLGPIDESARVWRMAKDGSLAHVPIRLRNASLASQAVGPVLSPVEMSCDGRSMADLAGRLLDERALATQRVAPTDSRLGALAAMDGMGLNRTYRELITAAFRPEWHAGGATSDGTPHIESNFGLYFGIAIQMYETTLVSDDTKYDRWMEAGGPAQAKGATLFTPQERRGAEIFMNVGQLTGVPVGYCAACHSTTLFSSATTPVISLPDPHGIELMPTAATARLSQAVFADHDDPDPLVQPLTVPLDGAIIALWTTVAPDDAAKGEEARIVASITLPQVSSGECPSTITMIEPIIGDDPTDPIDGELFVSVRRRLLPDGSCANTLVIRLERAQPGRFEVRVSGNVVALPTVVEPAAYDRGFYNIGVRPTVEDLGVGAKQGNGVPLSWSRRRQLGLPTPELDDPTTVPASAHIAANGAFKTPGLRNIELTGPYMHNGGMSTLHQVMEFYNRGGDFHEENIADLSPDMNALQLTAQDMDDVVAFMLTLTDERVRDERAPFDHPELELPNGDTIPAVGAEGRTVTCIPPVSSFEAMLAGIGAGPDCDGNGRTDACEVEQDPWLDVDGNGQLDACQCLGDLDGSGVVDSGDLTIVLASWADTGSDLAADVNRDGLVNGDDLVLVLSGWGHCNG